MDNYSSLGCTMTVTEQNSGPLLHRTHKWRGHKCLLRQLYIEKEQIATINDICYVIHSFVRWVGRSVGQSVSNSLSFILFVHSSARPSLRPSVRPPVCLFVRSFVRSFFGSFVRSFVRSFLLQPYSDGGGGGGGDGFCPRRLSTLITFLLLKQSGGTI